MDGSARGEARAGLRVALLLSLILNVGLATALASVQQRSDMLAEQLEAAVQRREETAERLKSLRRELEAALGQMEFYRSQAENYSSTLRFWAAQRGVGGVASVNAVAVRAVRRGPMEASYEGVAMRAEVELRAGKGRVLINTLTKMGIDLQASAQTAARVAEAISRAPTQGTDIIVTIEGGGGEEVVDGPSIGAALAVAMIAAASNQTLSASAYITGTINPDASIGEVSGILEKGLAAAQAGAEVFLIPMGQGKVVIQVAERREIPGGVIITYRPQTVSLQEYLRGRGYDVRVIEVATAAEAYQLMRKT